MSDDPTLRDQLAMFHKPMYTPYDPETGKGLERPEPTFEEIRDEYVAPGRAASHATGILYQADHETLEDGMCRQARTHAAALARLGVPLMLVSINHSVRHGEKLFTGPVDDLLHPQVRQEVGALRHVSIRAPKVAVYQTLVRSGEQLRALLVPGSVSAQIGGAERVLARSIVYTPWERSTVDPSIVKLLNRCGQVWLQCAMNIEVFEAAGVEKERIRLVPNAYDPNGPVAQIPNTLPTVPTGKRFYNIGKWEPRKNQHELLGAFLHTFEPRELATLTIKTHHFGNWNNYPSPRESAAHWLEQPHVRAKGWTAETFERRVFIYDRIFREEEMVRLHARSNIYVSAGLAEGWDYPAFDAVTASNRLVYVGYGGVVDYAPADAVRVAYDMQPVHSQYQWEDNAKWAKYSLEEMCRALRMATPRAERRFEQRLADGHGADAIGRLMMENINEMLGDERFEEVYK